jgi:hypothetical protein
MNKTPKGDTTSTRRQSKRRAMLNKIAISWGYASWSAYETSLLPKKNKK